MSNLEVVNFDQVGVRVCVRETGKAGKMESGNFDTGKLEKVLEKSAGKGNAGKMGKNTGKVREICMSEKVGTVALRRLKNLCDKSATRCIRHLVQPGKTYRRACFAWQKISTASFA